MKHHRHSPLSPLLRGVSITPGFALVALVAALALALLLPSDAPAQDRTTATQLDRLQTLLDSGRPFDALDELDRIVSKQPKNARARLLRSTARFMIGELEDGRKDLDRALKLDPTLRQGWLNRAALDLADQRYDEAISAFEEARKLDPANPDTELNIGAVLLFQGKLGQASERFQNYLRANPSAAAYYLVATNYAAQGYAGLAVEHLRQAISLDERSRLKSRADPNFQAIADDQGFVALLSTDGHRTAAGDFAAASIYEDRYRGGSGPLLSATLSALRRLDEPFDSNVETTQDWAIVWADFRIKIGDRPDDQAEADDGIAGYVEITAPRGSIRPAAWQRRVEELLRQIDLELIRMIPRFEEDEQDGGGA